MSYYDICNCIIININIFEHNSIKKLMHDVYLYSGMTHAVSSKPSLVDHLPVELDTSLCMTSRKGGGWTDN